VEFIMATFPPLITADLPDGLPPGLEAVSVVGREGLNLRPHWTAKFRAREPLPAGLRKRLRDKPVALHIRRTDGSTRTVGGVVNRVRVSDRELTLELVSKFQWALQHGEDSRVYVKLPAVKVLERIFTDRGVKKYLVVHGSVPPGKPRPHTVTYRESPFHLAERLIEEEGWYYTVTRTRSGEKLVVGDGRVKEQFKMLPPVTVVTPAAGQWPGAAEVAWVEPWTESRAGGGVKANAVNWETPRADLSVTRPGDGETDRPRPDVYEYGTYATAEDGERMAKRRAERARAAAGGVSGVSGCVRFAPGSRVRLNGREYLITTVWHEAQAGDREVPPTYHNRFDAIRANVTFRPPLSGRRPAVGGKLPGVVVGRDGKAAPAAGGPDVVADRWGRVRVRFAFDRPRPDGEDTAVWVRPGQLWVGDRFGGLFLPPVGSEVMVGFEGGDLDRPVLDSYHHNPANRPPVDPAAEPYLYGVWGRPGKGKVPASKLAFNDRPGKEAVELASRGRFGAAVATTGEIDCGERLTLKVGKSSLTLTPDAIVLTVGDTSAKLTADELRMIAKEIHLN
jgi:type VI secretion system secreted protein VgrG